MGLGALAGNGLTTSSIETCFSDVDHIISYSVLLHYSIYIYIYTFMWKYIYIYITMSVAAAATNMERPPTARARARPGGRGRALWAWGVVSALSLELLSTEPLLFRV